MNKYKFNLKTKLAIKLGTAFLRRVGSADDAVMMKHISRLIKILRFVKQNELAYYVDDVLGIYKRGPKYTKIVKEMLLQSDDEEFADLFYGLVNLPENVRLKADFHKTKLTAFSSGIRILVASEEGFYSGIYEKCIDKFSELNAPIAKRIPEPAYKTFRELTNSVFANRATDDVLVIQGSPTFNSELLLAGLNRAKHIIICGMPDYLFLESFREKLRRSTAKIYFYMPSQKFYPYIKAKQIIEDNVLGTVSSIKVKTVLGKTELKYDAEGLRGIMMSDLYDKMSYVHDILGEPSESFSYGNTTGGLSPAWTLLTKYKRPRIYSVYEFVHAPEMRDAKKNPVLIEKIEITGTAGILWLNWQKQKVLNEPVMALYVGDKEIKMGAVEDNFSAGIAQAVHDCMNNNLYEHARETFEKFDLIEEQLTF